jgi:hypothetical protein
MSTRRNTGERKHRPATTDEGRESQLISLAWDLAEQQLRKGTASAQVITAFLKLGTKREALEQERLVRENLLLSAKVDAIASAKHIEELYETALNAMREYAGRNTFDED